MAPKRYEHFSRGLREKIWKLSCSGKCSAEICNILLAEGVEVSRRGVRNFIIRSSKNGHIEKKTRKKTGPRLSSSDFSLLSEEIERSKGTVKTRELREILAKKKTIVSDATINRARRYLGLQPVHKKYCQHDLLAKKAGKAAPVVSASDAPSINLERATATHMTTSTETNNFGLHRRAASAVPVMADLAATISSGILAQNEQVNLTRRNHPVTDAGDILLTGATEPPENPGVEGPGGAQGISDEDTRSRDAQLMTPAMLRELIIAINRMTAAVEKQNEILEANQQVREEPRHPITHHIHTGEEDNGTTPKGPVIPESKIRSCVEKAGGSRSRLYKYLLEEIIPAQERIGTTPTTCPKDKSNPNIQKLSNSILDYAEGIVFSRIPWGASERDDAATMKRKKASARNALNTNWRKAYCKGMKLRLNVKTENVENNVE